MIKPLLRFAVFDDGTVRASVMAQMLTQDEAAWLSERLGAWASGEQWPMQWMKALWKPDRPGQTQTDWMVEHADEPCPCGPSHRISDHGLPTTNELGDPPHNWGQG